MDVTLIRQAQVRGKLYYHKVLKMAGATRNIILSVCSFILFTELCERLSFYTFSGTLVEFMTSQLGSNNVFASQMSSLFSAFVYLTPLLGGWIADEHLGRYKTILVFVTIYIVGLLLCTAEYANVTLGRMTRAPSKGWCAGDGAVGLPDPCLGKRHRFSWGRVAQSTSLTAA